MSARLRPFFEFVSRPTFFARAAVLALLAVAAVAPPKAAAQDEEARVHFSAGASYYSRGDYARALEEFQLAQTLSGRPELFYNIALCHQQLGDLTAAEAALNRYLQESRNVQDRETIEARLENLRLRIRQRDEAAAAAAAAAAANANSTQTTNPDEDESEDDASRPPPPGWTYIGFGVAGAGAIGWATFGGLALSNRNSIADGCGAAMACTDDDVATMDRLALLSDISMGVTIAGAALGIVGLVVPRHAADDAAAASTATLMVTPILNARTGTLGVSVGGRF
jgi:tetratricopeptide (TPR) repeat protein